MVVVVWETRLVADLVGLTEVPEALVGRSLSRHAHHVDGPQQRVVKVGCVEISQGQHAERVRSGGACAAWRDDPAGAESSRIRVVLLGLADSALGAMSGRCRRGAAVRGLSSGWFLHGFCTWIINDAGRGARVGRVNRASSCEQ